MSTENFSMTVGPDGKVKSIQRDDDDLGETFRALRKEGQAKRAANAVSSEQILVDEGIEFKKLSGDHLRVDDFDYWPSTGLFINMKTKLRGRGVFNLIKRLRGHNENNSTATSAMERAAEKR